MRATIRIITTRSLIWVLILELAGIPTIFHPAHPTFAHAQESIDTSPTHDAPPSEDPASALNHSLNELGQKLNSLLRRLRSPWNPGYVPEQQSQDLHIPADVLAQDLGRQLEKLRYQTDVVLADPNGYRPAQPHTPQMNDGPPKIPPALLRQYLIDNYFNVVTLFVQTALLAGLSVDSREMERFKLHLPRAGIKTMPKLLSLEQGSVNEVYSRLKLDFGPDGQADPVSVRLSANFIKGLEFGAMAVHPNEETFIASIQFLAVQQLFQDWNELQSLKKTPSDKDPVIPEPLQKKFESLGALDEIREEQNHYLRENALRDLLGQAYTDQIDPKLPRLADSKLATQIAAISLKKTGAPPEVLPAEDFPLDSEPSPTPTRSLIDWFREVLFPEFVHAFERVKSSIALCRLLEATLTQAEKENTSKALAQLWSFEQTPLHQMSDAQVLELLRGTIPNGKKIAVTTKLIELKNEKQLGGPALPLSEEQKLEIVSLVNSRLQNLEAAVSAPENESTLLEAYRTARDTVHAKLTSERRRQLLQVLLLDSSRIKRAEKKAQSAPEADHRNFLVAYVIPKALITNPPPEAMDYYSRLIEAGTFQKRRELYAWILNTTLQTPNHWNAQKLSEPGAENAARSSLAQLGVLAPSPDVDLGALELADGIDPETLKEWERESLRTPRLDIAPLIGGGGILDGVNEPEAQELVDSSQSQAFQEGRRLGEAVIQLGKWSGYFGAYANPEKPTLPELLSASGEDPKGTQTYFAQLQRSLLASNPLLRETVIHRVSRPYSTGGKENWRVEHRLVDEKIELISALHDHVMGQASVEKIEDVTDAMLAKAEPFVDQALESFEKNIQDTIDRLADTDDLLVIEDLLTKSMLVNLVLKAQPAFKAAQGEYMRHVAEPEFLDLLHERLLANKTFMYGVLAIGAIDILRMLFRGSAKLGRWSGGKIAGSRLGKSAAGKAMGRVGMGAIRSAPLRMAGAGLGTTLSYGGLLWDGLAPFIQGVNVIFMGLWGGELVMNAHAYFAKHRPTQDFRDLAYRTSVLGSHFYDLRTVEEADAKSSSTLNGLYLGAGLLLGLPVILYTTGKVQNVLMVKRSVLTQGVPVASGVRVPVAQLNQDLEAFQILNSPEIRALAPNVSIPTGTWSQQDLLSFLQAATRELESAGFREHLLGRISAAYEKAAEKVGEEVRKTLQMDEANLLVATEIVKLRKGVERATGTLLTRIEANQTWRFEDIEHVLRADNTFDQEIRETLKKLLERES